MQPFSVQSRFVIDQKSLKLSDLERLVSVQTRGNLWTSGIQTLDTDLHSLGQLLSQAI